MTIYVFWLKFQKIVITEVHLTITHYWFLEWYLNSSGIILFPVDLFVIVLLSIEPIPVVAAKPDPIYIVLFDNGIIDTKHIEIYLMCGKLYHQWFA